MGPRFFIIALLGVAHLTANVPTASAEPSADEKRRAGAAFDEGVTRFKQADYGAAARAFLLADDVLPNAQAISNAIAAGRKANDFLLVARAAERALGRNVDRSLASAAREALSEAAGHLAVLEIGCDVAACELSLDATRVPPGRQYVAPGTHDVTAQTGAGDRAQEHVNAVAGSTYRLALHPQGNAPSAALVPVTAPAPSASAPSSSVPDVPRASGRTIPPAVFYVGAGATAVLVALTTWSGLDALAEKQDQIDKHDRHDPAYDQAAAEQAVNPKAHRTTAFLAATAVIGVTTAYVGLRLVKWGDRPGSNPSSTGSVFVSGDPSGAFLTARSQF